LKRKEKKITERLIKEHWENKECDEYFKDYFASNKVTGVQPTFPVIKIKPCP